MNLVNKYDRYSLLATFLIVSLRVYLIGWGIGFNIFWLLLSFLGVMIMWTIKHNHMHKPFFIEKIANSFISRIYSLFTGTPMNNTKISHLINHHPENDSWEDWTSLKRAKYFKWELIRLFTYPFVVLPTLIKGKKKYVRNSNNPRLKNKIRKDNFMIISLILLCLVLEPLSTLYYFIIPIFFGQWFLLASNYFQHYLCDEASDYNHSNNHVGPVYNTLFFNVGFHAAHHKYPRAHWTELPKIHKEEISPYNAQQYNKPNFIKSFITDFLFKLNY